VIEHIKRIVGNLYPEIRGGYHLPRFGRVLSVSDAPNRGGVTDNYRPRYAVNVQVLKENGKPDTKLPVFYDLSLPAASVGMERGDFGFPEPGCIVEVGFAYGSPQRPFIRTVLGVDVSMPELAVGDQRRQTAPGVFDQTQANGDKSRTTFGNITDTCYDHTTDAATIIQRAHSLQAHVSEHSAEHIGGVKKIEAMGGITLQSGGFARFTSVGHLSFTTAFNFNQYASGSKTTYIGEQSYTYVKGAVETKSDDAIESFASNAQRLRVGEDGKLYIGNDSVNIVKSVADLAAIVKDLATKVASHVHPSVGAPTATATQFTASATQTGLLKDKVDAVAE